MYGGGYYALSKLRQRHVKVLRNAIGWLAGAAALRYAVTTFEISRGDNFSTCVVYAQHLRRAFHESERQVNNTVRTREMT